MDLRVVFRRNGDLAWGLRAGLGLLILAADVVLRQRPKFEMRDGRPMVGTRGGQRYSGGEADQSHQC